MRILTLFVAAAIASTICGCKRPADQQATAPAAGPAAPAGPQITPITDLSMSVTVSCSSASGAEDRMQKYVDAPGSLRLGTVAVLNEGDGQRIRLIDDVRKAPSITRTADGAYALEFHYTPEFGDALVTHDVSELRGVSSVGTRYAGVLTALGCSLASSQVSHLAMSLNGRQVVSADVQGAVSDSGADFQTIDVGRYFQAVQTG